MTDFETIIFNECINDRSDIHLYHSVEPDAWQAFGVSAYLLEQIATDRNISRLTVYSQRTMMPSVVLTVSELRHIMAIYDWDEDESGSHIILYPDIRINRDNYRLWAKVLREIKKE